MLVGAKEGRILAGLVPCSELEYMVQPIGLDREMQWQARLHRSAGDPTLRSGNAEYADCVARGAPFGGRS
jgi:hypothetical protein